MRNNTNGKSFGRSVFENSLQGFGSVLAGIAALLTAGHIWQFTADPVYAYLLESYQSEGLASIGTMIWAILSTIGIYFLCRAVFIITLMVLAEQVLFRLAF